jgi:hypothetical protein
MFSFKTLPTSDSSSRFSNYSPLYLLLHTTFRTIEQQRSAGINIEGLPRGIGGWGGSLSVRRFCFAISMQRDYFNCSAGILSPDLSQL